MSSRLNEWGMPKYVLFMPRENNIHNLITQKHNANLPFTKKNLKMQVGNFFFDTVKYGIGSPLFFITSTCTNMSSEL